MTVLPRIGRRIVGAAAVVFFAIAPGLAPGATPPLVGQTPVAEARPVVASVDVLGLPAAETANVRAALGVARLVDRAPDGVSEARLGFLLDRVPDEARAALEPFGWYSPTVEVRREPHRDGLHLVVDIAPGDPVLVRRRDVVVEGPAGEDRFVMREVAKGVALPRRRFVHAEYEADKTRVDRKLAERGYFTARREASRVEVSRAGRTADIDVRWDSGPRHAMGPARFAPNQLRPGLLDPLVAWRPGEPWHRDKLVRLQQRLAQLDYFAAIQITPAEDEAGGDLRVPVDIATTPARRTTYSAALSVGSDSGPGLRGGISRRWVNQWGHKWQADGEWSAVRAGASTAYRIPALGGLPGWYRGEAGWQVEDPEGVLGFERRTLRVGWRGQRDPWTLSAEVVAATEDSRSRLRRLRASQRMVYPELTVEYREVDDALSPASGLRLQGTLRAGGIDADGQQRRFAQLALGTQWLQPLGGRQRVLLRAEAGTTRLDGDAGFPAFPASLRFFAGGDRSVRGYGYREIGPRVGGEVLGGFHLLTASAEVQHDFDDTWGVAAFVDAGDATATRSDYDPKVGVGVGLRWRSPVGLVSVDVARGLDREAGGGTRLHLGFGVPF